MLYVLASSHTQYHDLTQLNPLNKFSREETYDFAKTESFLRYHIFQSFRMVWLFGPGLEQVMIWFNFLAIQRIVCYQAI